MNETVLSASFITNKNIEYFKRTYEDHIMRTTPETPIEFEIGKVIVESTISTPDLFDERFRCRTTFSWLCTREEFDAKFEIIDDANRTETFALITQK